MAVSCTPGGVQWLLARLNYFPHAVLRNRDTTTESLRNMFSQFGELEDAVVTTDRASGKSKGYGFVTFRYAANAAAAVAEPEKQLDVRDA